MKQYRGYAIYCMKSITTAILVYACFNFAIMTILHIHLSEWLFWSSALLASVSAILHTVWISKGYVHINALSIFMGILSAAVSGLFVFLSAGDIVATAAAVVYMGSLWKVGWNISHAGLVYFNYRQSLMKGLLFIVAVTAFAAIFGLGPNIPQFGRYAAAYFITGIILLRSAREYQYIGAQRSRKADAVNTAINIMIVLVILLLSSDTFMSYLSSAAEYLWSVMDDAIIYVSLIVAYPFFLLFRAIQNLFYPETAEMPDLNKWVRRIDPKDNHVWGFELPPAALTAIKIMALIGVTFIIFKIARGFYWGGPKEDEFEEEKEFIYNPGSITNGIKKALSSLFHRKDRPKPRTLAERIRYLYYDFLELSIKSGTYRSVSDTPRDINHRSLEYLDGEGESLGEITRLYEAARYGQGDVSEDDFSSMKSRFEDVSIKYNSKSRKA